VCVCATSPHHTLLPQQQRAASLLLRRHGSPLVVRSLGRQLAAGRAQDHASSELATPHALVQALALGQLSEEPTDEAVTGTVLVDDRLLRQLDAGEVADLAVHAHHGRLGAVGDHNGAAARAVQLGQRGDGECDIRRAGASHAVGSSPGSGLGLVAEHVVGVVHDLGQGLREHGRDERRRKVQGVDLAVGSAVLAGGDHGVWGHGEEEAGAVHDGGVVQDGLLENRHTARFGHVNTARWLRNDIGMASSHTRRVVSYLALVSVEVGLLVVVGGGKVGHQRALGVLDQHSARASCGLAVHLVVDVDTVGSGGLTQLGTEVVFADAANVGGAALVTQHPLGNTDGVLRGATGDVVNLLREDST